MWLWASVLGLTAMAAKKASQSKRNIMTPQREMIFKSAMNGQTPVEHLHTLAEAFEKEGLRAEADLLRKRAALRVLPDKIKTARANVVKEVYTWTDPDRIEMMCDAFEKEGAVGCANDMRRYAQGLRDAGKQKPAEPVAASSPGTSANSGHTDNPAPVQGTLFKEEKKEVIEGQTVPAT